MGGHWLGAAEHLTGHRSRSTLAEGGYGWLVSTQCQEEEIVRGVWSFRDDL
jgi:hypothetical protein